jgi:curved DNA-binding protein CbpA
MPKVDCWRLLGVAPDASAEEVRAGFARRVRDVHPDSGGTGDALTMRLLVEARDEALELVGRRGSRDTRR